MRTHSMLEGKMFFLSLLMILTNSCSEMFIRFLISILFTFLIQY